MYVNRLVIYAEGIIPSLENEWPNQADFEAYNMSASQVAGNRALNDSSSAYMLSL